MRPSRRSRGRLRDRHPRGRRASQGGSPRGGASGVPPCPGRWGEALRRSWGTSGEPLVFAPARIIRGTHASRFRRVHVRRRNPPAPPERRARARPASRLRPPARPPRESPARGLQVGPHGHAVAEDVRLGVEPGEPGERPESGARRRRSPPDVDPHGLRLRLRVHGRRRPGRERRPDFRPSPAPVGGTGGWPAGRRDRPRPRRARRTSSSWTGPSPGGTHGSRCGPNT